jgi:hypothetical protein
LIRSRQGVICQVNTIENANPVIEIEYLPGTEVIIERPASRVGDSSHFLKLLGTQVEGNDFHIVVEGRNGEDYQLRVRSHKPILRATNAELDARADGEARLRFTIPKSGRDGYVRQIVRLEFGKREIRNKRK